MKSKEKPILYLIPCNHFDLAWRRPFRNDMEDNGKTYVSYSKIEQYYIEDNIALCQKYPQYKFCIESVAVVHEFLKNRPDMKDKLVSLAKSGRVFVPGSGYSIIDANMVLGETIVRNYLTGILWTEDNFNQKNIQAYRADAFGNSAQLPQIFKGFELKHAFNLSYVSPDGKYWRGLDGSTVSCEYLCNSGSCINTYKYAPCKKCNGTGIKSGKACTACGGRGIDTETEKKFKISIEINEELLEKNGMGFILLGSEEYLPKEEVIKSAQELSEKYDVRFVNPEEPLENLKEMMDSADNAKPSELNSSNELNPSSTGCYVSRIESKQIMRKQEYAVLAAETLACYSWICKNKYDSSKLEHIWQELFYMAFHDCITGTVVDAAYKELQDVRSIIDEEIESVTSGTLKLIGKKSEKTITVINPYGFMQTNIAKFIFHKKLSGLKMCYEDTKEEIKVVNLKTENDATTAEILIKNLGPYCSRKITYCEAVEIAEPTTEERNYIENSRFKIVADENGIHSIFDKQLGKEISVAGEYHPGELVLEHDEGSPWSTLSDDRKRYSLSGVTKLVSVTRGNGFEQMTFETEPYRRYNQCDVSAITTVTLTEGIDRIDFHSSVQWNSFNHRLRIAFPVAISGEQVYGIPYGYTVRKNYEPQFGWNGADGDYPAINWAGIDNGINSVAVFNKGTPSYKMEQDGKSSTIFLSVLRSPAIPTCLHEPDYYTMTEWNGMLDSGNHEFDYSICAYDSSFANSNVVADAAGYNAGLLAVGGDINQAKMPAVHSDNVLCTSIKRAEKENGIIARLVEYRGKSGAAEIDIPDWAAEALQVNLLERQGKVLKIANGKATISVRPFEITTILFKKSLVIKKV